MKRAIFSLCLTCFLAIFLVLPASAHGGKTDGNGGHTDRETGEYHYHHGYPAHDHYDMDGDGDLDCPYDFDDRTGLTSGKGGGTGSATPGTYSEGYDKGYKKGRSDGWDDGYDEGKDDGYDSGYKEGYADGEDLIPEARRKASESAYIVSAIFGIPVVVLITCWFGGRIRDKADDELYAQIRDLKTELKEEQKRSKSEKEHYEEELLQARNARILHDVLSDPDTSIDIPAGIGLTTICVPVKGKVSDKYPYGDYTVFTSPKGSRYHCKYRCGNATKPIHFFTLPGGLEPCKNCVPRDMYPQSLPEWYSQIANAACMTVESPSAESEPQPHVPSGASSVESTCISTVEYHDQAIYITFKTGGKYCYYNVPKSVYNGLLNSQSKGKYFHEHIEGKYPYAPIA